MKDRYPFPYSQVEEVIIKIIELMQQMSGQLFVRVPLISYLYLIAD
jgi:hypothetical protein